MVAYPWKTLTISLGMSAYQGIKDTNLKAPTYLPIICPSEKSRRNFIKGNLFVVDSLADESWKLRQCLWKTHEITKYFGSEQKLVHIVVRMMYVHGRRGI